MWKPVVENEKSLGLVVQTVGELKNLLQYVPDNYLLSVIGTSYGMLMDTEEEVVLMDEVPFLENLLIEQENKKEKEM